MKNSKEPSPILSLDVWKEVAAFKGSDRGRPERYAFPMSTMDVERLLEDIGIYISLPGINRVIRHQEMVIPLIGRNRIWNAPQVETLIAFIVSGQADISEETLEAKVRGESALPLIPSWMRFHSAEFYAHDIDADEWARAHMEYVRKHSSPLRVPTRDQRSLVDIYTNMGAWWSVPDGAALVRYDRGDKTFFKFVPVAEVEKHFADDAEPAPEPKPAAKKPAKKGRK